MRPLLLPILLSIALCGCMAPTGGDRPVSGPYAGGMLGGSPGR